SGGSSSLQPWPPRVRAFTVEGLPNETADNLESFVPRPPSMRPRLFTARLSSTESTSNRCLFMAYVGLWHVTDIQPPEANVGCWGPKPTFRRPARSGAVRSPQDRPAARRRKIGR